MEEDIEVKGTKEIGTSAQMCALYGALAKAQGDFQPITKNRSVSIDIKDKQTGAKKGSYQFRYADLEEVTAKTRPALSANGLATTQQILPHGNQTELLTKLLHADGGSLESRIIIALSPTADMKNFGAALSYLRRYAKSALLDVAADDDLDENGQEPEDQSQNRSRPETNPANDDKPEAYPDASFTKNIKAWTESIQSGAKTAERIIAYVEKNGVPMTEGQKARLNNVKVPTEQESAE